MAKRRREMESAVEDAAEGGEGGASDIDTRDIFEKALDIAAPVAGAYLGMKGGSRIFGSRAAQRKLWGAEDEAYNRLHKAEDANDLHGYRDAQGPASDAGRAAGKMFENRFIGGAVGGAAGGTVTHYQIEDAKKRRNRKTKK